MHFTSVEGPLSQKILKKSLYLRLYNRNNSLVLYFGRYYSYLYPCPYVSAPQG